MQPEERIHVYREQYWLRHLKNLEEDYPTLARVLGSSPFRELAREYLLAFPPRTWDLQRLGADMPAFVATHPRWRAVEASADAATLDWAFVAAFDAADVPPFDPGGLRAVPEHAWASARVLFHPSLQPLALRFAVHELREAAQLERPFDGPAIGAIAAPTHLVVARDPGCFLRATVIARTAFRLMDMLRLGTALGDACASVAEAEADANTDVHEFGERLSRWFEQWTANGWVSAVHFPASE
jgi:hypothetical protein